MDWGGGGGGGGAGSNRDLFCIVQTWYSISGSLKFLHRINNIEHNMKQDIYTEMGVISLIPP